MAVKPIPDEYHNVTPYLVVKSAAELIQFMTTVFDGKETERISRPDGSIGHAEVRIGDSAVMLGEACDELPATPAGLYVYVEDVDAVYAKAIEAGASPIYEPADQFYGDRSGGVRDSCGNAWFIATRKENLSSEELSKRAAAAMK
jgi:PhnB protein